MNNGWAELDVNRKPEGDALQIFCSKCGIKNRHDKGWRYCDSAQRRRAEELELARLGYSRSDLELMLMTLGMTREIPRLPPIPRLPQLAYECGHCRDDPVASRTRWRANRT
jgi:hypothetical protein